MVKYNVFLKAIHPDAYHHKISERLIENGRISGLYRVIPDGSKSIYESRLCYKIRFTDGLIDYVPLCDIENGNFEIVDYRINDV
jgi:hypothetical protein